MKKRKSKVGVKRLKNESHRKGLSPVIATILLIGIVVVSALIVFTWFRGLTQEAITKFGENAQITCNNVDIRASYSNGALSISNGNIPVYRLMVKTSGPEGFTSKDIKEIASSDWPDEGLEQGGTLLITVDLQGDKAILVPILRGNTQKGGEASFVCNENLHGLEISL